MVRPTMGRPCSWSKAATVELSTPPLMATATMPGEISLRSGRVSNWISGFMLFLFYAEKSLLERIDLAQVGRRDPAPLHKTRSRCRLILAGSDSWVGRGLFAVGGGEYAQLGDGGRHDLQREVDFGGGGVAAQAEAQTGAGFFRQQADGGENVRGFDSAGGAGGSGGTSETLQVQGDDQRFALEAREYHVGGVRSAWRAAAVCTRMRHALQQALFQPVAQYGDALGILRQRFLGDFRGGAQSDNSR